MNRKLWLAASLLSADMGRLEWSIRRVARNVDYMHCDVMDGHFVPNLTFGPPVIKAIKRSSPLPLDVHLMIENPTYWIGRYLDAGLGVGDFLTFHIEAEPDPVPALLQIRKAGVGAGISIKPRTPAKVIAQLVEAVDQVLVMTVEPGFGGQSFIEEMLPKISEVRSVFPEKVVIAVDGGIDRLTAPKAVSAGARLLVAGNAIYGQKRVRQAADVIRGSAIRAMNQLGSD